MGLNKTAKLILHNPPSQLEVYTNLLGELVAIRGIILSGVSCLDIMDLMNSYQGFIQRGGRGGFIPLMILARGGYPPHQTAEQCFL